MGKSTWMFFVLFVSLHQKYKTSNLLYIRILVIHKVNVLLLKLYDYEDNVTQDDDSSYDAGFHNSNECTEL